MLNDRLFHLRHAIKLVKTSLYDYSMCRFNQEVPELMNIHGHHQLKILLVVNILEALPPEELFLPSILLVH